MRQKGTLSQSSNSHCMDGAILSRVGFLTLGVLPNETPLPPRKSLVSKRFLL